MWKWCGYVDSEIKYLDKKEKKDRYLRNVNFELRGFKGVILMFCFVYFLIRWEEGVLCLLILLIFFCKKSYEEKNNFVDIIKICII